MFHHAVAERLGLNPSEHKAADMLLRYGPMTAGELAEETGLTTGAITGLVDRLEKTGYVRREPDTHDRRRVIVTPVYAEKCQQLSHVFEPLVKAMGDLMSHYTPQEAAAITDFCTKAAEVLKQETLRLRQETNKQTNSLRSK